MLTQIPVGFCAAAYVAPPPFVGGNISHASLYEAAQAMVSYTTSGSPTAGGTLTINGVAIGSYDFCVKQGAQTISAFTATDWFTATQDTRSAFIVVNGSLTINAGITVIPTVRKLFVVVYCTGNLSLGGGISMSLRGANHSGTGSSGGATTAGAVRIATGTFSGVANPTILAAGASGGAAVTSTAVGNAGQAAGASLRTGGGGSGGKANPNTANPTWGSGAGASGTCFSGGAGGGAFTDFFQSATGPAAAGVANGGAGGAGVGGDGGVGNPSPSRVYGPADDGTGGVLVVICGGTVSGAGTISANGGSQSSTFQSPAPNSGVCGGASGGGFVCLMGKSISGPTLSAAGGTAISSGGTNGGAGGAGTTSQLIIP